MVEANTEKTKPLNNRERKIIPIGSLSSNRQDPTLPSFLSVLTSYCSGALAIQGKISGVLFLLWIWKLKTLILEGLSMNLEDRTVRHRTGLERVDQRPSRSSVSSVVALEFFFLVWLVRFV